MSVAVDGLTYDRIGKKTGNAGGLEITASRGEVSGLLAEEAMLGCSGSLLVASEAPDKLEKATRSLLVELRASYGAAMIKPLPRITPD